VPTPRKHRHRYHGVFAPNHKLWPAVTALALEELEKSGRIVAVKQARMADSMRHYDVTLMNPRQLAPITRPA
jgi:hypothetical protein